MALRGPRTCGLCRLPRAELPWAARRAGLLPSRPVRPGPAPRVMRWFRTCLLEGRSPFLCSDLQYPVGAPLSATSLRSTCNRSFSCRSLLYLIMIYYATIYYGFLAICSQVWGHSCWDGMSSAIGPAPRSRGDWRCSPARWRSTWDIWSSSTRARSPCSWSPGSGSSISLPGDAWLRRHLPFSWWP